MTAKRAGARRARRPQRARVEPSFTRSARTRLRRFRQATLLAVAVTSFLLLLSGESEGRADAQQESQGAGLAEPADPERGGADVTLEEAQSTLGALLERFLEFLPRLAVCVGLLLLAWIASRLIRTALRRLLSSWERSAAIAALTQIGLFFLALVAGLSILVGDITALLGSVGLLGLALSWALQTPIESFTGWVLNALRGYYRPGDRIQVGEIFGDVYRIDVLTTTIWEAGGPDKPVTSAQPTGGLVTFPNGELLRSSIVNYSRDFPYVWDEVSFAIANESDLDHAGTVVQRVAARVVGEKMAAPAREYRSLLKRERLAFDIHDEPEVYFSLTDSWTNCVVRYLVPLRQRRRWASALIREMARELSRSEHAHRILPGYPRNQFQFFSGDSGDGDANGEPTETATHPSDRSRSTRQPGWTPPARPD